MGQEHEGGQAEQVGGIAVQLEGAAEENGRRHDRGPHHGNVAANEQRVEGDRRHRDQALGGGPRTQPAEASHEQGGYERDLGSREREHVVGAGGPEGVGRRIVDPRAVPEHHRANETFLRPRQDEAREDNPGRVSQPRHTGEEPGSPPAHLDEPRALADAAGVDSVVEPGLARIERAGRAKAGDRPDHGPETQAVPVEDHRRRGSTTDVDAHPPGDGAPLSRFLDPFDVEDQQGAIREHGEVTPCGPLERDRSCPAVPGAREGQERSRLVGPSLDRAIRGAERHGPAEKGDPDGTAVRRDEREEEEGRREPRQGEDGTARGTTQKAAGAEGDRQCEQRGGHRPPL